MKLKLIGINLRLAMLKAETYRTKTSWWAACCKPAAYS